MSRDGGGVSQENLVAAVEASYDRRAVDGGRRTGVVPVGGGSGEVPGPAVVDVASAAAAVRRRGTRTTTCSRPWTHRSVTAASTPPARRRRRRVDAGGRMKDDDELDRRRTSFTVPLILRREAHGSTPSPAVQHVGAVVPPFLTATFQANHDVNPLPFVPKLRIQQSRTSAVSSSRRH